MTAPAAHETDIPAYPMKRPAGCPFDPPPELTAARAEGRPRRVRLWDGSTPWLVTGYAEARRLLRDPRLSADPMRPGYPKQTEMTPEQAASAGFVLMDDPEHTRQRRLVTAPFAIKKVQAMRPGIQRTVDDTIDAMLAGGSPADLVQALALPVPSLVICQLLGVPYADHDFFQENAKKLGDLSDEKRRDEGIYALGGYIYTLLEKKRNEPADDLLSGLAEFVGSGETDTVTATKLAVLLLFGGHETTANMIALGTLALLEHPDQLALLRDRGDDPGLVASAVDELLRYLSVVNIGTRRAVTEDIEVGGQLIKAGEGIILPLDIANRDPEVFARPDELDLRRDIKSHLAFSFGPHQCLGLPLARLELEIVYATLYRRIPTLRLAVPADRLTFKENAAVYGVTELPVAWD